MSQDITPTMQPGDAKTGSTRMLDGEPHVLIVDDDAQIRQLAAKFLRANGLRVSQASHGVEMREMLRSAAIDLVVLDIMLPGRNGLELCRDLRATSAVPVIMLTAKGDETDRIVGLEVGADDYIAKPFNPRELLARIKAVLRRSTGPEAAHSRRAQRGFAFDGWSVDLLRRELTNPDDVLVDLSAGEFDLLLAFLEAPNRILSRDHLLDAARNRVPGSFDRSIDVLVSRLRRKIEQGLVNDQDMTRQEKIKTVRGAGYLFLPKVTHL
jgi:two-component system, OmpR family, response regulator